MTKPCSRDGMTMVEVLMVVVIIGLLSALLVPAINLAIRGRQNAECARKLRTAVQAFELYAAEVGSYPADRYPGVVPPEMAGYYFPYFKIDWWDSASELGGGWDWDNGYNFDFSVSISSPTASAEQLAEFDRLIDDGNLNSGNFRKVGSQYHYILED